MTTYNVTITEETMISLLMDRVEFWLAKSDPAYDLYKGFITKLVENGYYEGRYFDPLYIVDTIYINDTVIYSNVDEALSAGYSDDDIAYIDENTGSVLVWC